MRLGPYEVVRELGRGGAGIVFEGRSPRGERVALKLLARRPTPEVRARFEREARLLTVLADVGGFVPLRDVGESAEGVYIAMPLVEGGTLRERLEAGPLPLAETVSLAKQLASAMARAHEMGIIHRDLKPENVLFARAESGARGDALIADMGLAKHFIEEIPGATGTVSLSQNGEFRGTAGYAPPEQLHDFRDVRPSGDVFALGAIIYECASGTPAFSGASVLNVLTAVLDGRVRPLEQVAPGVPSWLAAVVARSLQRDPADRYPDARALLAALPGGAPRRRRRHAAALLLGGLAAAAVAGVLALSPAATAPKAPATTAPPPPARALPAWFQALPRDDRPPRIPDGIVVSDTPNEYRNVADLSTLVFVPGGTSSMGTDEDLNKSSPATSRPAHSVSLDGFFIGKYEVSVGQFARFVAETGYITTAERSPCELFDTTKGHYRPAAGPCWRDPHGDGAPPPSDHPVLQVSIEDIRAYGSWAGTRLPTEAEWEKAATWDRATGTARRFAWDDSRPRGAAIWNDPRRHPRTAPVDAFTDAVAPCGAYGMGGNAWELCEDAFDARGYSQLLPASNPLDAPRSHGTRHAIRGFAWVYPPSGARLQVRTAASATPNDITGFRVCRGAGPHELDLQLDVQDTQPHEGQRIRITGRVLAGPVTMVSADGEPWSLTETVSFELRPVARPGITSIAVVASGLDGSTRTFMVPVSRPRPRTQAPDWFEHARRRPSLPLPPGIVFTSRLDEYELEADGSVLVYMPGTDLTVNSEKLVLSPFFFGKYEVAVDQLEALERRSDYRTTAERIPGHSITLEEDTEVRTSATFRDPPIATQDGRPVRLPAVYVTWSDASEYARRVGAELPTERQWSCGASFDGTKERPEPWGDRHPAASPTPVANLADESFRRDRPPLGPPSTFPGYDDRFRRLASIGSVPAGASASGALDLVGNVWEWCRDGAAPRVATRPLLDPVNPPADPDERMALGGGWRDRTERTSRARLRFDRWTRRDDLGFRLCVTVTPR